MSEEDQQIKLALKLSEEEAARVEAARKAKEAEDSKKSEESKKAEALKKALSQAQPEPVVAPPKSESISMNDSIDLQRHEATSEQKQEWRHCRNNGPTILNAREMRYRDLLALLMDNRQVLLGRKQVVELHDHETITGRIIILPDGFVLHLLGKVIKLQRKLREYKEANHFLRKEVERLIEEARLLIEKVRDLEQILRGKDDEIRALKEETKRLNSYVEQLLAMVKKSEEIIQEDNKKIRELERENQRLRDKAAEEEARARRYHRLLERSRRENHELRHTYDCRRNEVINILVKPLPDCGDEEGDKDL